VSFLRRGAPLLDSLVFVFFTWPVLDLSIGFLVFGFWFLRFGLSATLGGLRGSCARILSLLLLLLLSLLLLLLLSLASAIR
jgi:hypothetical protein